MKKKYFIPLAGGLGNQMLQYSLYLFLKSNNYTVFLYHKLDSLDDHNGFELNLIFKDLKIPFYQSKAIDIYSVFYKNLKKFDNFLKKRHRIKKFEIFINFLPYQIVNFPTWDDYTFIKKIQPPIWDVFQFQPLDIVNDKIANIIKEKNSVSIHVRRGDYVNDIQWRKVLGDVCDVKYYLSAINKMILEVNNPFFVIFSDDIEYVKTNLNLKDAVYVDWNIKENSYKDMQLMSMCKHHIIANSTFSLMAAWLNTNINKIIICPTKWRNFPNDTTHKLYLPDEWTLIDNCKPNISLVFTMPIAIRQINKILSQSYRDFEVILSNDDFSLEIDSRIFCKSVSAIRGNYIFEYSTDEKFDFSDRHFINNSLENRLKELIRK